MQDAKKAYPENNFDENQYQLHCMFVRSQGRVFFRRIGELVIVLS